VLHHHSTARVHPSGFGLHAAHSGPAVAPGYQVARHARVRPQAVHAMAVCQALHLPPKLLRRLVPASLPALAVAFPRPARAISPAMAFSLAVAPSPSLVF
jgi:hypothetical protein